MKLLKGSQARGFTLIEVMITVVILAILFGIAMPSYMEFVRKSRRAEAKATLMEGAQALERYYSVNMTYLDGGDLASVFPTQSGEGAADYTVAADPDEAATATTFSLKATRTGSMTDDPCGDFLLDEAGNRTISGGDGTRTVDQCW